MGRLAHLRCAIAGHTPGPGSAWNHGYCFGHCLRCGTPIMRAVFGEWRPPPPGYRIVWPVHRRRVAANAPAVVAPPAAAFARAPVPAATSEPIWDFMTEEIRAARRAPPPRSDAFDFSEFMEEDVDEPPSPPPLPRRRVS